MNREPLDRNRRSPGDDSGEHAGTQPHASAIRKRRLLLGTAAAAAAALASGALVQRWRDATVDRNVAGIAIHRTAREMPPLRFLSGTGAALDLVAFRGRTVLLNIWATWCGPCREEMPTLDRLQALLGGPQFEVLALSIDAGGMAAVKPFFDKTGIRHLRPYIDGFRETGAIVGTGVPLTLLINPQGREVGRKLGEARWDDPAIVELIRHYLPGGKGEKAAHG